MNEASIRNCKGIQEHPHENQRQAWFWNSLPFPLSRVVELFFWRTHLWDIRKRPNTKEWTQRMFPYSVAYRIFLPMGLSWLPLNQKHANTDTLDILRMTVVTIYATKCPPFLCLENQYMMRPCIKDAPGSIRNNDDTQYLHTPQYSLSILCVFRASAWFGPVWSTSWIPSELRTAILTSEDMSKPQSDSRDCWDNQTNSLPACTRSHDLLVLKIGRSKCKSHLSAHFFATANPVAHFILTILPCSEFHFNSPTL